MDTFDTVSLVIACLVIIFIIVHSTIIRPRQERKREDRMMVFKVSTIFHLRGRDDLAERVMNAKNIYEVEAIVRKFEIERGKQDERSEETG